MFPDIISLNFSLTVVEIEPGKGEVHSMVVGYILCQHSDFLGWPVSLEQCGPFSGVKITVTSPDCSDPLQLATACVSASVALDQSRAPENVLTDDDTYWAPAIRTGPSWEHFIQIFMRRKVGLNRIKLYGVESEEVRWVLGLLGFCLFYIPSFFRKPVGVRVFVSLDGLAYTEAKHTGCLARSQFNKPI